MISKANNALTHFVGRKLMFNSLNKKWNLLAEIEFWILILLPVLAGFAVGISLMRGFENYPGLIVLGFTSFPVAALSVSFLRRYLLSVITYYVEENYSQTQRDKFHYPFKETSEMLVFINTTNDVYLKEIWVRCRQYGRLSLLIWLIGYSVVLMLSIFNIINLPVFLVR
jgi:hypothetical protein